MDTLTHALVGALAGRSYAAADDDISAHQRTLAGGLTAAFPDLDYLTFWLDPLAFLSDWHRGPTHSLLLLPAWALLLGLLWSRLYDAPRARWQLVGIAALALASHIAVDLATVYGTAILYPLSDWRPGLGTTFVIDPWLTMPLAVLLLVALWRHGTLLPRATLVLLAAALTGHALLQRHAVDIGREYAQAQGLDAAAVRAIAQPLSPLHWKLVVPDADGYRMAHIRLTGQVAFPPAWAELFGVGALSRAYRRPAAADWQRYVLSDTALDDEAVIRAAWRHPLLTRFRRFAAWPALYRIDRAADGLCVWFTDLRFTLPSLVPAFRYGLCRSAPNAPWQRFRIRRFSDSDIEPV